MGKLSEEALSGCTFDNEIVQFLSEFIYIFVIYISIKGVELVNGLGINLLMVLQASVVS